MIKSKFRKTDPAMLAVLDELDCLTDQIKQTLSSMELESTSSVSLNQVLERIERLRMRIACMSHNDTNWVGILQALVRIAQYVEKLWKSD